MISAALFAAFTAFGAPETKEVTLTGTGTCAKCALGLTDSCQNALVVKQDGKEQTYLLAKNPVSTQFHKNVCKSEQQIKVTGTVKDNGGQKEITASKIELVKG